MIYIETTKKIKRYITRINVFSNFPGYKYTTFLYISL